MSVPVALLFLLLPYSTLAYPDRVPLHGDMCVRMSPRRHHGNRTATGLPPFKIDVPSDYYNAGEPLKVTILANGDNVFRGFFLQARQVSNNGSLMDRPIGVFSDVTDQTKALNCSPNYDSWGHTSSLRRSRAEATWVSSVDEGEIQFRATIVGQRKSEFWEGVTSLPLRSAGPPGSYISPLVMAAAVYLALALG